MVDEEHPTTKSDSEPYKQPYEETKNLGGSFSNEEITIIANDPRHDSRARSPTDLIQDDTLKETRKKRSYHPKGVFKKHYSHRYLYNKSRHELKEAGWDYFCCWVVLLLGVVLFFSLLLPLHNLNQSFSFLAPFKAVTKTVQVLSHGFLSNKSFDVSFNETDQWIDDAGIPNNGFMRKWINVIVTFTNPFNYSLQDITLNISGEGTSSNEWVYPNGLPYFYCLPNNTIVIYYPKAGLSTIQTYSEDNIHWITGFTPVHLSVNSLTYAYNESTIITEMVPT